MQVPLRQPLSAIFAEGSDNSLHGHRIVIDVSVLTAFLHQSPKLGCRVLRDGGWDQKRKTGHVFDN